MHVLLTMRSDFVGDCARFHGLPEAVSASQFLVPSLTRDRREAVIRGPLDKAGATIEPACLIARERGAWHHGFTAQGCGVQVVACRES